MADEEQYDLFCTHCGQRITNETVYCPACGTPVQGMAGEPVNDVRPSQISSAILESRLRAISIVFVVSAVIMLGFGIYYCATVDQTMDEAMSDSSWDSLVDLYESLGYTEQQLEDVIRMSIISSGVIFILSGIALGISATCGFTKKMWILGFVCCIIATVLTATTILGLIVGIIMSHLYHTTKPCFT